ncbi:ribonuclease HI [Clostridia bacterium OttesenSCG-928-F22]|nr:ribonuclease HI [Clostridia bacterium OttesenSCG-928-F22]
MKQVTIYTDGACSNNPGPGGWGAILMYKNTKRELSGYYEHTTNNRMELTAAIEALNCLKERCEVSLYTDSAYLVNAFTNGWIYAWQRNGWKTSNKQPVENQDLWKLLISLGKDHNIKYIKVKGHSDNEYNNACDKLARQAIKTGEAAKQRGISSEIG